MEGLAAAFSFGMRVDETYIKVKAQEKYLYRTVDSAGQTIDFPLAAKTRYGCRETLLSKGVPLCLQSHPAGYQGG